MLPAIWLLLYEGVKTYSSLYSVFFNIPCHLTVLINGVTLPGDGFPIQRVVMNILQLIESGKPTASCSPQLSVWIKKQSRPYEPRYHGFARMTIKCLQPCTLKTGTAKRPLRNLGVDGRVLRKRVRKSGLGSLGWTQSMGVFCGHVSGQLGFMKCWKYLDYLRDYNLMIKESVTWSTDNDNKFLWRIKTC